MYLWVIVMPYWNFEYTKDAPHTVVKVGGGIYGPRSVYKVTSLKLINLQLFPVHIVWKANEDQLHQLQVPACFHLKTSLSSLMFR